MKLTRNLLKDLISEELTRKESLLLEMPEPMAPGDGENGRPAPQKQGDSYSVDPDGYEGEMSKRALYHMSQQAQQLHDMLANDENLEPWVQDKITKAADYLEKAFKAITYDKGPGQGKI